MAKILFALLAVVTLILVGCSTQPTQVIVTIDAEAGVRAADGELHLVVGDRFDQVLAPGGFSWGLELALAPLEGDSSRTWSVTASSGGVTARAVGGYVEGETLSVTLVLEDACKDVLCGAQETCSAGACVGVGTQVVEDGGAPVDAGDAGVDAGQDAGPIDGGGSCPTFQPGTWRRTYTQTRSFDPACDPSYENTISAPTFEGLQTPCTSGQPTCAIHSTSCTTTQRDWQVGAVVYHTRFDLITSTLATGRSQFTDAPDGCVFDVRAERIGP